MVERTILCCHVRSIYNSTSEKVLFIVGEGKTSRALKHTGVYYRKEHTKTRRAPEDRQERIGSGWVDRLGNSCDGGIRRRCTETI